MNDITFFDNFAIGSSYDSEGRLLTKEQEIFFKNSKCRDFENQLLVLYHASNNDFNIFDVSLAGTGGGNIFGKGFYFSDDDFGLDIYGKYLKEYYLNLQNPFIWADNNLDDFISVLKANNFKITDELLKSLEEDVFENDGGLDTVIEATCGVALIQKYFMAAGFDGIMNIDVGDYVAFFPDQIKLCSNKMPTTSTNIAA